MAQWGVEQPFFLSATEASTPFSPTNYGNMYRWWVSTDVSNAVQLNVTNKWNDRVVTDPLSTEQPDSTNPTNNTTFGVFFPGGTYGYLTNRESSASIGIPSVSGGFSNSMVVFYIAGNSNTAVGNHMVLGNINAGNGTGIGSKDGTHYMFNSGDPGAAIPNMPQGGYYDISYYWSNQNNGGNSTNIYVFTNGVFATNIQTSGIYGLSFGSVGVNGAGLYWKGWINEIILYTNLFFVSSNAFELHKYGTNRLGRVYP